MRIAVVHSFEEIKYANFGTYVEIAGDALIVSGQSTILEVLKDLCYHCSSPFYRLQHIGLACADPNNSLPIVL
jgi:hypothetical protein